MKILIADDERLARERLERLVARIGGHEVVAGVADGAALRESMAGAAPDIVLLDVDMPGEDGIALGAWLAGLACPPAVIYVTAHPEHALRAFGAHPVDYLLKPVSEERLRVALEAAGRVTRAQLSGSGEAEGDRLVVRNGRNTQVVPVSRVICFEAGDKYVTACLPEGEVVLDESLRELEDRFGSVLLRVHRGTLVAVRCIERLELAQDGRHWLHLRGLARPVEVSRRQLRAVKEWLAGAAGA
ncbi:MAG: LytR/AlgR family response regulator transcription factor [Pseudomonadota bacterium]